MYYRAMSESPVVRRMVMFKHGVAYLERGGPAEGPFDLSFRKDEMNDVLKSLAVWVAKGDAQIGALAFEKPEDPEAELERRKLNLPAWGTMLALLGAIKGRRVAALVDGARREGEVLGVEAESLGDRGERRRLLLREGDGRITMHDVATLESLELLDPASRADLAFFVDRSRAASAGETRSVHIDVRGKAEDLRVSYVVPAPTWRVSYRIARSKDETVLMAWGIVHNPADEDLDQISLVLTTGQPVSFVIDLYNPKNVRRAVVEERERAVAAPTQFERAAARSRSYGGPPAPGAALVGAPAPRGMTSFAMAQEISADDEAPDTGRSFGDAGMDEGAAAAYADRGELFEYKVAAPVSLKRGGSAMVPLVASKLESQKERLWRVGPPSSPDLVVTFKNASGAVLEEGPAVIYDDDVYAGEAMMPYTARGSEVKLAYAKDLAVRCRFDSMPRSVTSALRVGEGAMIEEIRAEVHHVFRADSDHAEPARVVFELPKVLGRVFDAAEAKPFESTASYHRFEATVAPQSFTTINATEVWVERRKVAFTNVSGRQLGLWMEGRLLDQGTYDALAHVLRLWHDASEYERTRTRVEGMQREAYAKQTKLAEQLKVLKDTGPEGALRLRYVKELEAEQDKVNGCEAEMARLLGEAQRAKENAHAALRTLTTRAKDT